MHKDIQLTKMDNAYEQLLRKVQQLMEEHMDEHGQAYALYAMRELAIELASRHLLSIPAVVAEDRTAATTHQFLSDIQGRLEQLTDEAVALGIIKRAH